MAAVQAMVRCLRSTPTARALRSCIVSPRLVAVIILTATALIHMQNWFYRVTHYSERRHLEAVWAVGRRNQSIGSIQIDGKSSGCAIQSRPGSSADISSATDTQRYSGRRLVKWVHRSNLFWILMLRILCFPASGCDKLWLGQAAASTKSISRTPPSNFSRRHPGPL